MSVQIEKLEGNLAKLTIEVPAEKLEKAMMNSYNKQKNSINMPGFRKGKVPYQMVEKMYGPEIFYDDAANELMQEEYPVAVKECGEDIVSNPRVDIVQIEKGKPFIFTAEVALKPEVTLGKYKGVTVTKIDTSVSDEDVEAAVEKERENNARMVTVEGRAVKDGDTAVIDFDGYSEGKPFDGGKAENYPLVIGSHSFIDTFEEQLIGKNVGDELDVNVTFPENYQAPGLAGKPAVFKVKINEIKEKELPELDDEFAQDVSEFDTLDEYKNSLKEKLAEDKEKEARLDKEDEAIKKIVEKSKMDIPDVMIDTQVQAMIEEMGQNLAMQGISLEQYFQFTGQTLDALKEQCRPQAEQRIKSTLVLEAIAKEEAIEITDEQIDAELGKMAEQYGMDAQTLVKVAGEEERKHIAGDLSIQAAIDLIMDNVKERAKAKTKKEKEAEAAAAAEAEKAE